MGSPPTPAVRGTPAGIKLTQGYQALLTITDYLTLEYFEIEITPPGLDGGEPIDTTTMHNTTYRTFTPRSLKTLRPFPVRGAYDPLMFSRALALINIETTFTITWSDGSTLAFYAYLQKAEYGPLGEGTMPEMTLTVVPTNQDPTDKSEQAAAYADVAGT